MIQYRFATIDDLEIIYEFETAYFRELEPEHLEQWYAAKERSLSRFKKMLNRIAVATINGEVVGHASWDLVEDQPTVCSIYILPPHRKKGIAITLLDYAEQGMIQAGFNRSYLATLIHNPAQHLFKRAGYRIIKEQTGWFYFEKIIK